MTSKPFLPKMNPTATRLPDTRDKGVRSAVVAYANRTSTNIAAFVFNVSARTVVRWRTRAQR